MSTPPHIVEQRKAGQRAFRSALSRGAAGKRMQEAGTAPVIVHTHAVGLMSAPVRALDPETRAMIAAALEARRAGNARA